MTPARREFQRARASSLAELNAPIGAVRPKSSSVTANATLCTGDSPVAASRLSTPAVMMPPAQKLITLTSSAPVTSATSLDRGGDPRGVRVEVPVGLS